MDKQFQVGDIVVWDEAGIDLRYVVAGFGHGPFEILDTNTPDWGHILIKPIDEATHGSYIQSCKLGFTCRPEHIRPAVFLTAAYRATHAS